MTAKSNGSSSATGKPRIVETYQYTNEAGALLYQTLRYEPGFDGEKKTFRQRRPVGPDKWEWNLQGMPRVLYRLPELLASKDDGRPVFIPEGERDVDRLRAIGLIATTNAMGAGKWLAEYREALRGRHVVILPDNDQPGRKHAEDVARSLASVAATVKIVTLPDLQPKGDVSNWLDAGGDKETLLKLVLAAPAFQAGPTDRDAEERPSQPIIVSLADVKSEPVRWLWLRWIPRGTLTLLDGDPGLGKSTITTDLAARVSRGFSMPPIGGPCEGAEPEGVLLLSAEDDLARTIRPRLDAAGADVSRVLALTAIRDGEAERPPVLPWDLAMVEDMIRERKIALVVIDPFMAYLDGNIDAHRDQDVRRALHQLAALASRTVTAIVLVRHLNKMTHNVAIYRGGGSIGIMGAVRSALVAGRYPEDPRIRVLASSKSNLGPTPTSLSYTLETVGDVARVGWVGEVDLTANDILSHAEPKAGKIAKAAQFLRKLLAPAPMPAREIYSQAKAAGLSERTLDRAKKEIGIEARKSEFGAGWAWALPAEGCHEECQPHELAPFGENQRKTPEISEGCQVSALGRELAPFEGEV